MSTSATLTCSRRSPAASRLGGFPMPSCASRPCRWRRPEKSIRFACETIMARVDRQGDVAAGAAAEQLLKVGRVAEEAKTRRRSTKAEQRAETMEQILDEAELLFSRHGLHGVTLKDVAKRVGVHHTLLN